MCVPSPLLPSFIFHSLPLISFNLLFLFKLKYIHILNRRSFLLLLNSVMLHSHCFGGRKESQLSRSRCWLQTMHAKSFTLFCLCTMFKCTNTHPHSQVKYALLTQFEERAWGAKVFQASHLKLGW